MKTLLLWANPTQPNLGVQALAAGAKALLQQAFPGCEVVFEGTGAHGPAPIRPNHTTPLLQDSFARTSQMRSWLQTFDLVLDMRGGDSFTDIYGQKRFWKSCVLSELAVHTKIPVVYGPQTIGPFNHFLSDRLARLMLRRATGVLVRDSVSAEVAQRMGRPVDAVSTDVVFMLERPEPSAKYDVLLNVSGLLWSGNQHGNSAAYQKNVHDLITTLTDAGREVTLFPHVLGAENVTEDNDSYAVQQLQQQLSSPLPVVTPDSLDAARMAVAGAEIVIGARMHACLNALSVGTPALPMAYSRKFAPLLNDLGWEHTSDAFSIDAPADLVRMAENTNLVTQAQELLARTAELQQAAVNFLRSLG